MNVHKKYYDEPRIRKSIMQWMSDVTESRNPCLGDRKTLVLLIASSFHHLDKGVTQVIFNIQPWWSILIYYINIPVNTIVETHKGKRESERYLCRNRFANLYIFITVHTSNFELINWMRFYFEDVFNKQIMNHSSLIVVFF